MQVGEVYNEFKKWLLNNKNVALDAACLLKKFADTLEGYVRDLLLYFGNPLSFNAFSMKSLGLQVRDESQCCLSIFLFAYSTFPVFQPPLIVIDLHPTIKKHIFRSVHHTRLVYAGCGIRTRAIGLGSQCPDR